jgi:hypothetical protein
VGKVGPNASFDRQRRQACPALVSKFSASEWCASDNDDMKGIMRFVADGMRRSRLLMCRRGPRVRAVFGFAEFVSAKLLQELAQVKFNERLGQRQPTRAYVENARGASGRSGDEK